jgi:hypothetical protein
MSAPWSRVIVIWSRLDGDTEAKRGRLPVGWVSSNRHAVLPDVHISSTFYRSGRPSLIFEFGTQALCRL